ncbi:hypothetical protein LZ198_15595 [Myxococcus sp. K15C18031901]|uniref:hypothetical protein n=1 Tax=Myxococcus dinghuensis TaxID=2906761 RepID=UPI0020A73A4F|nr:hypothetical protein [Myxococcus dinghuensis]MCP3100294.1 hypothetical protein [Myxococcus dinghuensis]
MVDVFRLLAVSAVVMGASQTIARERIFAPFRERLGGRDTWWGYLVSCPYCVSHYVAFLLVPLTGTYGVDVVVGGWPGLVLRWFLSSLLVTVVAAFFRVLFWFVDESQGLVRRRQKTEDEETATRRLVRRRVERKVAAEDGGPLPPPPPSPH